VTVSVGRSLLYPHGDDPAPKERFFPEAAGRRLSPHVESAKGSPNPDLRSPAARVQLTRRARSPDTAPLDGSTSPFPADHCQSGRPNGRLEEDV